MPRRKTIEEVRHFIEKQEYILLSEQYDYRVKLNVQCLEGHEYKVGWGNFQQGHRCPYCAKKANLTYQQVKKYVERQGYVLLSEEYKNAHSKLDIKCSKGHQYQARWNDFQQGRRCPHCAGLIVTFRQVREYIERQGYTLLSKKYKNNHTKIDIECPKGHQYRVTWSEFQQGNRCPHCAGKVITYRSIKDYIERTGYILLSKEYKNCCTKLNIECSKGHQYEAAWDKFRQGHRCPYCLHKSEHKLGQILEELFPNKIKKQGNLGFLGRQRVDYYIEQEKIAIEYDGIQHHEPIIGAFGAKTEEEAQEQLRETQERDKRKEQLCKENGWRLIRVGYDEPLSVEHIKKRLYSISIDF